MEYENYMLHVGNCLSENEREKKVHCYIALIFIYLEIACVQLKMYLWMDIKYDCGLLIKSFDFVISMELNKVNFNY